MASHRSIAAGGWAMHAYSSNMHITIDSILLVSNEHPDFCILHENIVRESLVSWINSSMMSQPA